MGPFEVTRLEKKKKNIIQIFVFLKIINSRPNLLQRKNSFQRQADIRNRTDLELC